MKSKLIDVSLNQAEAFRREGTIHVQPKYDGWHCTVNGVAGEQELRYLSSGNAVMKTVPLSAPLPYSFTLLGEYIVNTNWALNSSLYGRLIPFDLWRPEWDNNELYDEYDIRLVHLNSLCSLLHELAGKAFYYAVNNIPLRGAVQDRWFYPVQGLWNVYVAEAAQPYEGIVVRKRIQKFGTGYRIKRTFTMDYVVMAVNEGGGRHAGRMGSLSCGLYDQGKLVSKVSVGGGFSDVQRDEIWKNKEKYIGKVVEVSGKQLFSSGSMRHPNFLRWREDKTAEECVW